jgi:hypothetical protein
MESIWSFYQKDFDKIGSSKENIVRVKNFLNENDLSIVMSYLRKHEDDPEFSGGKMLSFKDAYSEDKEVAKIMIDSEKRIYDLVQENFCKKYGIKIKRNPWVELHFIKWREEMGSALHSDCQYPNGDPLMKSNYYKLNLTALIYPNSDYVGGEIGWPDYDVEIKPEPGDLVIFPANNSYLHYVKDVVSGFRYTMPIWYTFDNGAPEQEMIYDPNASKHLWIEEGGDTSVLKSY